MSDWGIKISRTGDVKTAGILDQTFNSEKNCFKLASSGVTTSSGSGNRTVEITHGLGLTPTFLAWFEVDSNGRWYPAYATEDYTSKLAYVEPSTDSTKLYLDITTDGSASVKIYYILFVDPGA